MSIHKKDESNLRSCGHNFRPESLPCQVFARVHEYFIPVAIPISNKMGTNLTLPWLASIRPFQLDQAMIYKNFIKRGCYLGESKFNFPSLGAHNFFCRPIFFFAGSFLRNALASVLGSVAAHWWKKEWDCQSMAGSRVKIYGVLRIPWMAVYFTHWSIMMDHYMF